MQTDYLQFIFQAINNLLTQNLGFFDAMGQNLFRMFATILVVWYGVKSALSAASGKHFLHFDNFAALLLTISFGFGMVNYYSTPIPGMGRSFHNLITDEAQFLSGKINQNSLQSVEQGITDFEARLDMPGFTDDYHTFDYKPQDAEVRYFLTQFCTLYYRRNRYTIQDDFSKSLYFLDGSLANSVFDAYKKGDIIKQFLTNSSASEIDIDVKNVALEGLQTSPYRARVDFDMVYYSPADHSELKRDLYTANFVFVFRSQVPNELIPINPLGLTVTYFREDQAFK